jgi:hypothetical protein
MSPGVKRFFGDAIFEDEALMKRFSLAMAAVLALLSIAGCAQDYYGKGKAPPPVFTKG